MEKPVISNQYGAFVMALLPFIYGILLSEWHWTQAIWLLFWLAANLWSYPFFMLFSRKPTERNRRWAWIYAIVASLFALPILLLQPAQLYFLVAILPLGLVQLYFAKQRDERHLLNDLAGILTFGVMGMASAYLGDQQLHWQALLHPSLFFAACTLYVKSMVRERKNPRYLALSIASHALLAIAYFVMGYAWIALSYLPALVRSVVIPRQKWNVKQVGMLEFPIMLFFLLCLGLQ